MKSFAIVSCFLIMAYAIAPCMAQTDTIKLVKRPFIKFNGNERDSHFPYDAVVLTMLEPITLKAFRAVGETAPITAIGPYKSKKTYGLTVIYNENLFLVSKRE